MDGSCGLPEYGAKSAWTCCKARAIANRPDSSENTISTRRFCCRPSGSHCWQPDNPSRGRASAIDRVRCRGTSAPSPPPWHAASRASHCTHRTRDCRYVLPSMRIFVCGFALRKVVSPSLWSPPLHRFGPPDSPSTLLLWLGSCSSLLIRGRATPWGRLMGFGLRRGRHQRTACAIDHTVGC
jgi:hypothetical protein